MFETVVSRRFPRAAPNLVHAVDFQDPPLALVTILFKMHGSSLQFALSYSIF